MSAYGIGIPSRNAEGDIIEVFYSVLQRECPDELLQALSIDSAPEQGWQALGTAELGKLAKLLKNSESAKLLDLLVNQKEADVIICFSSADTAPKGIAEAFLKLQLLSHRLHTPHEQNLDGIFAVLKNLAWTNEGPVELSELPQRQLQARQRGQLLQVRSVDKFPPMTDYVVPSGVRIADTSRVRLGAHIGEGTTVMHEGFVNFNAGTLGTAMIEGRISAGVVVGKDSDLGGGCSTMGTLSGGGTTIISVGRNCLIGANAGIGFPLADGCTVEAGLYVTGGSKVQLLNEQGEMVAVVKAAELSERPNLLFRRNSQSGSIECIPKRNTTQLNEALHAN